MCQVLIGALFFAISFKKLHHKNFSSLTFNTVLKIQNIILFGLLFMIIKVIVELIITYSFNSEFQFSAKIVNYPSAFLVGTIALIFSSTLEEVLFRGYFLNSLYEHSKKQLKSCVIVSVIFALAHFVRLDFRGTPFLSFLDLFLWSFFISIIALKFRSMEVVIGIHIFHNLFEHFILGTEEWALFIRAYGGLYLTIVNTISFLLYYFLLSYILSTNSLMKEKQATTIAKNP